MPRRVTLPGASELFRTTRSDDTVLRPVDDPPEVEPAPTADAAPVPKAVPKAVPNAAPDSVPNSVPNSLPTARGTGRVKHDEKITVYVSSDELLALERARLTLRAEHKMAVDRGRIVRQALAMALEELEHGGESSELVRRLSS